MQATRSWRRWPRWRRPRRIGWQVAGLALLLGVGVACQHVHPWQRERLASPALQFEMSPAAETQKDTILDITEGATYSGAGPNNAGAGCGCH